MNVLHENSHMVDSFTSRVTVVPSPVCRRTRNRISGTVSAKETKQMMSIFAAERIERIITVAAFPVELASIA